MSASNDISQQTIDGFLRECVTLKALTSEIVLTINLGAIVQFYRTRIGIHPVTESWDELRDLLMYAINDAKTAQKDEPVFNIRFVGGNLPVWLVMRIYALCVFEADGLFYAGDCVIKI